MNWQLAFRVFFDILIRDVEKGINIYILEDSEIEKYIKSPSNEKDEVKYVTVVEETPVEEPKENFPIYYMNKRI